MRHVFLLGVVALVVVLFTRCNNVSRFPIDDPARIKIDNTLLGKWHLREDTSASNYFLVKKKDDYHYFFTYMNQGGTNRRYENFDAFLSKVNTSRFLNITYWHQDVTGYILVRILDVNEAGDELTTVNIADTTLMEITNPAEVRARVGRNLNNPLFFRDTAHFEKIKGF
jgi:hypothetical protein